MADEEAYNRVEINIIVDGLRYTEEVPWLAYRPIRAQLRPLLQATVFPALSPGASVASAARMSH